MPDPQPPFRDFKQYLDQLVLRYERPAFIQDDPIAIPHGFDDPRDQEVVGLFAALLAWGQRKTILNKMVALCERMRYRPYRFIYDFDEQQDAAQLTGFKHRTFQPLDALSLTRSLQAALHRFGTIENLFAAHMSKASDHVGPALQGFSDTVMTLLPDTPSRLRKHLARPATGSACKRLNMYLRWMVRPGPVDLGIWTKISKHQLILPLDVHSGRQARALGLLRRNANDWKAALALTAACKQLDATDPARYDYALFGAGAYGDSLETRFLDYDLSRTGAPIDQ